MTSAVPGHVGPLGSTTAAEKGPDTAARLSDTPSVSLRPLFLRTSTGAQVLCGGNGVSQLPVISLAPRPRVTKLNAQRVSTSSRFCSPIR
jgi:hypothetical protein